MPEQNIGTVHLNEAVENQPPQVDLDQMLNNKKFVEALVGWKPDIDVRSEDEDSMKEKYKAFQEKEKVSKELVKIYGEQIFKDVGIRLNNADFKKVEACLSKKAFEDPDEIINLGIQIQQFKEMPQAIEEKKRLLEEQKTKFEGIKKGKEDIRNEKTQYNETKAEKLLKANKRWTPGGRNKARAEVESESREIDKRLMDIERTIEEFEKGELKQANEVKLEAERDLSSIKSALLFSSEGPLEEIIQDVRLKAQEKLKKMAEGKTLKDFESTQEYYNHLNELREGDEDFFHYLGDFEGYFGQTQDVFQQDLDQNIEYSIDFELDKAVENAHLGDKPLEALEKSLKDLLKKEKIGSKGEYYTSYFLMSSLTKICLEPHIEPAKKFLLGRIIQKIESGFYKPQINTQ